MCVVSWSELSCVLAEFCSGSLALVMGEGGGQLRAACIALEASPVSVFLPSAHSY